MKPAAEVTLTREPRGGAYRRLIDTLIALSAEGLFVVREQLQLGPDGKTVLTNLSPYRVREVRGGSWPGTELVGHFATLTYFRSCREAGGVLKSAVSGLFEWKQPSRPEDLCFFGEGGRLLLASIAHEGDAWLTGDIADDVRRSIGESFFEGRYGTHNKQMQRTKRG